MLERFRDGAARMIAPLARLLNAAASRPIWSPRWARWA